MAAAANVNTGYRFPPTALEPNASEGEAAVAATLTAAERIFTALREGADESRIQELHAEYEQKWVLLRTAAELVDEYNDEKEFKKPPAAPSDELKALRKERKEARRALANRNQELKEQIDLMRRMLVSIKVATAE